MNTNNENSSINDPSSLQSIVRSLDEGPNYQPAWRWLTIQKPLAEINHLTEPGDSSVKLAQILEREHDEIIRKTLEFNCGVSSGDDAAVEYALRAQRTPEVAIKIKAMVVANGSIEVIASKLGTQPAKIEFFEKLFFDVRRYWDKRDWLETICRGSGGHRLLQVAFERGWAGVEEIGLRHLPKGPRNSSHIISTFLGRAQAYAFEQEAANIPPSEKDLQLLLSALHANGNGQFPFLEDAVEAQPVPETETYKQGAKLSSGARERVRCWIEKFVADGARKAAGEEAAANEHSEPSPTKPDNGQPPEPQ